METILIAIIVVFICFFVYSQKIQMDTAEDRMAIREATALHTALKHIIDLSLNDIQKNSKETPVDVMEIYKVADSLIESIEMHVDIDRVPKDVIDTTIELKRLYEEKKSKDIEDFILK